MNNDYTPLNSTNPADIAEIKQSIVQNFQGDAANLNGDQLETQARINADNLIYSNINSLSANINILAPQVELNTTKCTQLTTVVGSLSTQVNIITTALSTETKNRTAADDALQANLTSEITTRSNVDIIHSTQIANLDSRITAETKDRSDMYQSLSEGFLAEVKARSDADTLLTTNLAAETKARTDADTVLTSGLAAETKDRSDMYQSLSDSFLAEAKARSDADAQLTTNLATETQLRIGADNSIYEMINFTEQRLSQDITTANSNILFTQQRIDGEIADRKSADTKLSDRITSQGINLTEGQAVINQRIGEMQTDMGNEVKARSDADTLLTTNLAEETKSRADADTALQLSFNQSIAEEAKNRSLTDTALQNSINACALQSSLDNEAKSRADADTALQLSFNQSIALEAKIRTDADTLLQQSVNELGDIYLKKISDSDLKMGALRVLDCSTVQTEILESLGGEIQCASTLNLQGFQNIQGVNVISAGESVTETTNTNNILSDLGMINIRGDFKGDNKASIQELTTLQSHSLIVTDISKNTTAENIRVNAGINMLGNNITGVGDLGISTLNGKTPMFNPATMDLDMKSYNIGSVDRLNVATLQSNSHGTTPIIIEDTLRTQSLIPDTMGFRNIGSATDPYDTITANAVFSTALSAFPGYTEIIVTDRLSLDNKNIVNVGTLSSTTINNSGNLTTGGTLRAGTILQDTSISCYAQYTQTISAVLSVPFNPTQLVLLFNTSLSPFNVTTSSPTFTSFTILHAGVYRCIYSVNGEMSVDRSMAFYFRKNGTPLRTLNLSRVGSREVEVTFNELFEFIVGDVLTISVQALDAAFTFTTRTACFNIEKIRRNTI